MVLTENHVRSLLEMIDYFNLQFVTFYELPNEIVYEYKGQLDKTMKILVTISGHKAIVFECPVDEDLFYEVTKAGFIKNKWKLGKFHYNRAK